ncbi:hypothetical protein ACF0H5_017255 [Mactra antiquata]
MNGFLITVLFSVVLVLTAKGEEECGKPADIAFIVDSSASIWIYNFYKQIEFVKKLITMFDIRPDGTQVAAITFADKIGHEFFFTTEQTKESLIAQVQNISHASGETTLTHDALESMRTELFAPGNGARPGVPKICILLTDGASTYPERTFSQAKAAKNEGIEIIGIGIGSKVNKAELQQVVSPPFSQNLFLIPTFGILETIDFQRLVSQQACKVIETTTTTKPTTTTSTMTTTTTTEETTTTTTTKEPTTTTTSTSTEEITTTPFWSSTTESADRAETCQGKEADVVFIVDMSSSIWVEDFKRQKRFLSDVVSHFDVNKGKTRVAMIMFSDNAKVQFYLDQYDNINDITDAISVVKSAGGITNTHMALELMMNDVLTKEHGARPNVAHICIIITDGRSRVPDATIEAAERVHASGVYVFSVGVGNMTDSTELRQMASDNEFAFEVNGYKALKKIKNILAYKTCEVPQGDQPRCTNNNINVVFGLYNVGGTTRRYVTHFMKTIRNALDLTSENLKIGVVEKCSPTETECGKFDITGLFGNEIDEKMANDMPSLIYSIRTSHLPSRFDKSDYDSYVILFISGKVYDIRKSYIESLRLRHRAEVLIVGVDGSVDRDQLKKLASYRQRSKPDVSHVFPVSKPEVLPKIVQKVLALIGDCA